ncbi:MAG: preprotein translocase subunit SecG [Desulfobacterales bacterium]
MTVLLIIVHVIACIALIMIVLLQTGKGADMGAAFGGGSSQTLFGSSGAGTFFGKATTAIAVIFMLTSLSLAYVSTRKPESSVMTDVAPVEETIPETPGIPAPEQTPAPAPAEPAE